MTIDGTVTVTSGPFDSLELSEGFDFNGIFMDGNEYQFIAKKHAGIDKSIIHDRINVKAEYNYRGDNYTCQEVEPA